MTRKDPHVKLGFEVLFDIKRRILRFIARLEVPSDFAKKKLKEMDQEAGEGRHEDKGVRARSGGASARVKRTRSS